MFFSVAKRSQLSTDGAHVVHLEGRQIALFLVDGEVVAYDNVCPHRGGPIGEGLIAQGKVTCPWHEWTFDLKSGCHIKHAAAQLTRHEVRLSGDDILVDPEPAGA